MTTTPQPASTDVTTLAFELELPHPAAKVWRALTEPALLTEWLLPVAALQLEPGAAFTLRAPPQPNWDGVVNCRMLEIDTNRRISWAWVVGDLDTVVTFTLAPTPAGTRLSVVHSGFTPSQKHNLNGARYGWKMMTGKLVDLLARTA